MEQDRFALTGGFTRDNKQAKGSKASATKDSVSSRSSISGGGQFIFLGEAARATDSKQKSKAKSRAPRSQPTEITPKLPSPSLLDDKKSPCFGIRSSSKFEASDQDVAQLQAQPRKQSFLKHRVTASFEKIETRPEEPKDEIIQCDAAEQGSENTVRQALRRTSTMAKTVARNQIQHQPRRPENIMKAIESLADRGAPSSETAHIPQFLKVSPARQHEDQNIAFGSVAAMATTPSVAQTQKKSRAESRRQSAKPTAIAEDKNTVQELARPPSVHNLQNFELNEEKFDTLKEFESRKNSEVFSDSKFGQSNLGGSNRIEAHSRSSSESDGSDYFSSNSQGFSEEDAMKDDCEQIGTYDFEESQAVSFADTNINQIIANNKQSGGFAEIWSQIIFASHTYNFLTVWYFLGLEGFPEGPWLVCELFVEIVLLFDFCMRLWLKYRMPNQWTTMWLLQYKWEQSFDIVQLTVCLLASVPQSLIVCLIFAKEQEKLRQFWIAMLRFAKLLRFQQISKFFETKHIERQSRIHSSREQTGESKSFFNLRTIQVIFYFLLATHMIGCIWLIIGRIDPDRNNWFVMARYEEHETNVRPVTIFEKYIDAVFYTVATMTGLGYGNIVPSTNLEYFVDIFIMITGSSIYAGFFADFAVEIYNQQKKDIENEQKHDQAKQFSAQRNLPIAIRERIRLYYNNVRLNFSVLQDKYMVLRQMPLTLRTELSLFFNCELIQKVKFFQLADPQFVLTMSRIFSPQICLQQDFVVEVGQVASKMFFIQQGIVQILTTDNKTVIAFQSQGCYFGEIGVLLTNKRSCSVRAVTMCIFMTVSKEDLMTVFDRFPQQGKFLRAIGRQRLLTTRPEDLAGYDENMFELQDGKNVYVDDLNDQEGKLNQGQVQKLEKLRTSFGNRSIHSNKNSSVPIGTENVVVHEARSSEEEDETSSLNESLAAKRNKSKKQQSEDFGTAATIKIDRKARSRDSGTTSDVQPKDDAEAVEQPQLKRQSSKVQVVEGDVSVTEACCRFWNTTENHRSENDFVIIPLSKLFNCWTILLVLAAAYYVFMVPFQLALDYDVLDDPSLLLLSFDIAASAIFILDIPFRSRLAYLVNQRGEPDIEMRIDQIMTYYVNTFLFVDLIAAAPLDYIMRPFRSYGLGTEFAHLLRMLKFFKISRLLETISIVKKYSNLPNAVVTFSLFFIVYVILTHFMATSYIYLGRREVGKKGRFDGQDMFTDVTIRTFITPNADVKDRLAFPFLPPAEQMTKIELYVQFMYLSSCTMGAVMYGDIIPFAMSEQLFDFIAMFTCRVFLAFLFAEAASYLSSVHKSVSQHTNRVQAISDWSDINQLPKNLKARILNFYKLLWVNFRGVRQQTILEDLPESLRQDVRQFFFKNNIENWHVMSKKGNVGNKQEQEDQHDMDNGVISSIIHDLQLRIIPQGEVIIKYGEVAQEMYFIVKGQVNIISADGIHLATIGAGENFGEMALLQANNVRTASVQAETDVTVAIMNTEDFEKICELYPNFKQRIIDVVHKRSEQNKDVYDQIVDQLQLPQLSNLDTNRLKSESLSQIIEEAVPSQRLQQNSGDRPCYGKSSSKRKSEVSEDPEKLFMGNAVVSREIELAGLPVTSRNKGDGGAGDDTNRTQFDEQINVVPAFDQEEQKDKEAECSVEALLAQNKVSRSLTLDQSQVVNMKFPNMHTPRKTVGAEAIVQGAALLQPPAANSTISSSNDMGAPRKRSTPRKATLQRKMSKVSLVASAINEHFNADDEPKQTSCERCFKLLGSRRTCMRWIILLLSIYNVIFIPLQFAYRIDFHGVYLFLEIMTIFFYLVDIVYRFQNLRQLQDLNGNIADSEKEVERTMMDDRDHFESRLFNIKFEIASSAIAFFPFSLLFQLTQVREPTVPISFLCLLRLAKYLPMHKLFVQLKSQSMQKWRVLEVIITYYQISHVVTCVWIAMGKYLPDVRESWIRRIPVPQDKGMRDIGTLEGVSDWSLYVHALYFVVNTVSHVAIGDITAVNTGERVFVAVLILFGTFIYSFLFGNIVSIVSDFAPSQHISYFEKYQYVTERLEQMKQGELKDDLIKKVNEYFEYIWSPHLGQVEIEGFSMEQHDYLNDLPRCIRSDLLLCKYQEAIQNSLIFKDDQGAIDVSLTNSAMRFMQIRVYLTNEFIFKVGSKSDTTYVILEGLAVLVGACHDEGYQLQSVLSKRDPASVANSSQLGDGADEHSFQRELIGFMQPGCHFGTDMAKEDDSEDSASVSSDDKDQRDTKYGARATCHMIARQPCIVGAISSEHLQKLFECFPHWKEKMQQINKWIMEECEKNLKRHDEFITGKFWRCGQDRGGDNSSSAKTSYLSENDKVNLRRQYIEHHYSYSSRRVYNDIIRQLEIVEKEQSRLGLFQNVHGHSHSDDQANTGPKYLDSCSQDLLIEQKIFFYGQEGKVFPIFDSQYQEALKTKCKQNTFMQVLQKNRKLAATAGARVDNAALRTRLGSDDEMDTGDNEQSCQSILHSVWQRMYFKRNSTSRRAFDLVQIVNLFYIAVATPLVIGFSIEIDSNLKGLEFLSLFISVAWICGNFRTQLLIKGKPTLETSVLYQNYKIGGLGYDILGCIPFNLIFAPPATEDLRKLSYAWVLARALLRSIRTFSTWRALHLFGNLEVSVLKDNQFNVMMQIAKAVFYLYFLGHFLACIWFFTVANMERGSDQPGGVPTWIDYNELRDEPVVWQYLRAIYTVFNIVCSVGYGDMFPMTDLERIFFTCLITIGDLLFALAFGLITRITFQLSLTDETRQFKEKIYHIQEFMNSINLDQAQQRRVEHYFAYEHKQKNSQSLIAAEDLANYLPYSLRQELMYQASSSLLQNTFVDLDSENLLIELAQLLEAVIFLPGDYVCQRGDAFQEMYFMAEGCAHVVRSDKESVVEVLVSGSAYGEIQLYRDVRLLHYVHAADFSIIRKLRRVDFLKVTDNYGELNELIRRRAQMIEAAYLAQVEADDQAFLAQNDNGLDLFSHDKVLQMHEEFTSQIIRPGDFRVHTPDNMRRRPSLNEQNKEEGFTSFIEKEKSFSDQSKLAAPQSLDPAQHDSYKVDKGNIIHEERSSQFQSSANSIVDHDENLNDEKREPNKIDDKSVSSHESLSSNSFRSDPSFYTDVNERKSKRGKKKAKGANTDDFDDGSAQQQAPESSTECIQGQLVGKGSRDDLLEPLTLDVVVKTEKKLPEVVVEPSCSPMDKESKQISASDVLNMKRIVTMPAVPEEERTPVSNQRPPSARSKTSVMNSGYQRQRSNVPDRSPVANLLNIHAEESLREFFSDSSASSEDDGSSAQVSGWPSNSNTTPLSSDGSPNAGLRSVQQRIKNAVINKKPIAGKGRKKNQMRRPSFLPNTEKMMFNQLKPEPKMKTEDSKLTNEVIEKRQQVLSVNAPSLGAPKKALAQKNEPAYKKQSTGEMARSMRGKGGQKLADSLGPMRRKSVLAPNISKFTSGNSTLPRRKKSSKKSESERQVLKSTTGHASKTSGLETLFKKETKGEQAINHTIRRMVTRQKNQLSVKASPGKVTPSTSNKSVIQEKVSLTRRGSVQVPRTSGNDDSVVNLQEIKEKVEDERRPRHDPDLEPSKTDDVPTEKLRRRLSRISLGRTLTLSQTATLQL